MVGTNLTSIYRELEKNVFNYCHIVYRPYYTCIQVNIYFICTILEVNIKIDTRELHVYTILKGNI